MNLPIKKLSKIYKIHSEKILLGFIFGLTFIFFYKAFKLNFFKDDFAFLNLARINYPTQFLAFFSPWRNYFYRPLGTEVFYFLIELFKLNEWQRHVLVFSVFFVGLVYLYRSLLLVSKNKRFSFLVVLFYALNFSHVFQLYWLATFQEIALFTSLCLSFYQTLNHRHLLAVLFFLGACLSKETAILYPVFLSGYFWLTQGKKTHYLKKLLPLFLISAVFLVIFKFTGESVSQIDLYRIQLQPKLIINNWLWYFLWSLGAANFFPEYFSSLLKPPLPDFYKAFIPFEAKIYAGFLIAYWLIFITILMICLFKQLVKLKQLNKVGLFGFGFFTLFICPTLPIIHRWMVRLTLPLLAVVMVQVYLLEITLSTKQKLIAPLGSLLIVCYLGYNFFGIKVHESSSSYFLESRFINNSIKYFSAHRQAVLATNSVYFQDPLPGDTNPWGGSEKLKVTYWGQSFFQYYFPEKKITAVYSFEHKKIPATAMIVQARNLLIKNE
jgi:hypothetical protein